MQSQPPPLPAVTTTVQFVSISVSEIISISRVSDTNLSSAISSTTLVPNPVAVATTESTSSQSSSSEELAESGTSQAVSSTTSSSAKNTAVPHPHGALFVMGVVIGGVLFFVFLSIICGWLLRQRWRRKNLQKTSRWNWDPEKIGQEADSASAASVGKASSVGPPEPPVFPWNRDTEAHNRSRSFKDLNPAPLLHFDPDGHGTPHLLPAHMRTPVIAMPELSQSISKTPEVPNTLGPLNVANLMPCDVSQWSRNSVSPGSEYGTPNEKMASNVPRFKGLGTGLPVPWTPQSNNYDSAPQAASFSAPPGLPVPPQVNKELQEAEQAAADDWASSWRSSLTTALNAVVGPRVDPQESMLRPTLSARQSIYSVDWEKVNETRGTGSLTRQSTASTVRGYSMEETADGQGVVHIHGIRPALSHSGGSRPSRTFTSHSEAIMEEPAEDEVGEGSSSVSRRSTAYSGIDSRAERLAKYYTSNPPRLPSIVPGKSLTMGEGSAAGRSGLAYSTLSDWAHEGGLTNPRRTDGISRTSTLSVGSSAVLSRASSLDPAEKEARKVLLMRRRRARAMAMSSGSGSSGCGRGHSRRSSLKRGISKRK
jgi:hypothetical protein